MVAAIGMIASLASGVIGAMGASYQAKAQEAQYKYQEQVAKMNERIAQENAKRALDKSRIEQENFDRTETGPMIGAQEQAQSASGLALTGRSMVETRRSTRMIGRYDAQNILHAGQIEAYNFRTQAANFAAEADAAKLSGKIAAGGAKYAVLGNLLGGVSGAVSAFPTGGTSLLGGAKSTAQQTYVPIPRPKPTSGLVY